MGKKEYEKYELEEKLSFLERRLHFRHEVFIEWLFKDKTIIHNIKKFTVRTKEIEDMVKKLKESSD